MGIFSATIREKWIPGVFSLFFSISALAQQPVYNSSADILLGIKKLRVLGSVLYVAAHPDDENTRLLTFFSREKLYRTAYLSLTRGDGGQNLIGNEQGVDLGLIRTQELLAARRVDGAEQFFTRAFDFGFSKNPDETFRHWDREKILADVVWMIRLFRPDIIITRFPTTGEGGHGHHTASAILAGDAFDAAANPARFPEQLKWVQPWQAKRLLWNTFNFGSNNTQREDQFKMDVGLFNPLLGKSYGEIAAESRSQHKSQGFGVPRSRGQAMEYFSTIKGSKPGTDLMEGVVTDWTKLGQPAIDAQIGEILKNYSVTEPQASIPGLVALYKELRSLPDQYWKIQKMTEVKRLIEACAGLYAEVASATEQAVQGDSIRLNILVNSRLADAVLLTRISWNGYDSVFKQKLETNRNFSFSKTVLVPVSMPLSQPYWLRLPMEKGYFNVDDQTLIGRPENDAGFEASFDLEIAGEKFTFIKPVQYKYTDPVKGELYQPLAVVPPLLVSADPALVVRAQGQVQPFTVQLKALKNLGLENSTIRLSNWPKPLATVSSAMKKGGYQNLAASSNGLPADSFDLSVVGANNLSWSSDMRQIRYDHIPVITYFKAAQLVVRDVELRTKGKLIGYIEGAGDLVPEAMKQMGYEVVMLTDAMLATGNLNRFDAIVTGVRAYNVKASLSQHYQRLMDYVKQGGNLVVQYNTNNQIGPVKAQISPFPFTISRNRVTDEEAKVNFLRPEHPVLNTPNKITEKDFEGWVQERGIYFATEVAPEFTQIFSMKDEGEKEMDGSLIVARHGKGVFVYTGLAFFRELPAGVPGAYRLFANILALNKKAGF